MLPTWKNDGVFSLLALQCALQGLLVHSCPMNFSFRSFLTICAVSWFSCASPFVVAQGGGAATTVQLPTFGVAIDAEGLLEVKTFADPGGRLKAERLAAAKGKLVGGLGRGAELRKISLRALEQALVAAERAGKPPGDEPLHLAGLVQVKFVFVFPPTDDHPGDIILAGPAEGWIADPAGRAIGLATGRPILLLEDLAVALRAFPPGKVDHPFLGCTIDPTREGLARAMEFQKSVPHSIPQAERNETAVRLATGLAESLGRAEIRVFGVSPRTHFAQALVEADYRMKRIAIGLEEPPIKMATFIGVLRTPREATLQRWWFTPAHKGVRVAEDGMALELVGTSVQLQSEDYRIGPTGKLEPTGQPVSQASEIYCRDFTQKYPAIAAASPVYAQMRGMMDLAIVAAALRKFDAYRKADWSAELLRDESRLACETLPAPKQVSCAVNAIWKGSRLLVPSGGGVTIIADEWLDEKKLLRDDQTRLLEQRTAAVADEKDGAHWWWD